MARSGKFPNKSPSSSFSKARLRATSLAEKTQSEARAAREGPLSGESLEPDIEEVLDEGGLRTYGGGTDNESTGDAVNLPDQSPMGEATLAASKGAEDNALNRTSDDRRENRSEDLSKGESEDRDALAEDVEPRSKTRH
jgi:hypothetical protein